MTDSEVAPTQVWVGTSWKMNKTIGESLDYCARLLKESFAAAVQPFILPPLTSLAAVRAAIPQSSSLLIGAQNAHWATEGVGTGEVSMRMVKDAGAALVEIGHSERRSDFGESDAVVALKIAAALEQGLTPILCVGESLAQRRSGQAVEFVLAQVRSALSRIDPTDWAAVLIAYEPIWAIGRDGRAAEPTEIAEVMAEVASLVDGVGGCRAVLYGGSVSTANAAELLRDPHTDGLFVGRAAWQPQGLIDLVAIAAQYADGA